MGHEGYLTEVYRRYNPEDLARFYKQGEAALLIFAEAGEVSKLRDEIEERNRQLQILVNGLTAENLELKEKVRKIEARLNRAFAFWDKWLADRLSGDEYEEYRKITEEA